LTGCHIFFHSVESQKPNAVNYGKISKAIEMGWKDEF